MQKDKIINFLNDIPNIFKQKLELNKIFLRNRKNTLNDCLQYSFLYRYKDLTQQSIISKINDKIKEKLYKNINFPKKMYIKRSSLITKSSHIPYIVYQDVLDKISSFYKEITPKNTYSILNCDGMNSNIKLNNTNYKETLTMGYLDQTKDIPYVMEYTHLNDTRGEINRIKDFIKNHKFNENTIIVCDRGMCNYEFYNFLNKLNIGFVIRIKSNCPLITHKEPSKYTDYFDDYDIIKKDKNTRIISYEKIKNNTIVNSVNDVKIINEISNFHIITNLNITGFPDEEIKKMYKNRWLIEIYFKHIKKNFKVDNVECNDENKIKINIAIDMILYYLLKLIEYYNDDMLKKSIKIIINNKTKEQVKVYNKFDKTKIFNGLKEILICDIFCCQLNETSMEHFTLNYVDIIKNKENRIYSRSCKNVSKKWYTKQFQNKQKIEKQNKNIVDKNIKKSNTKDKNKMFDSVKTISVNECLLNYNNETMNMSLDKLILNEHAYFLVILKKFKDNKKHLK